MSFWIEREVDFTEDGIVTSYKGRRINEYKQSWHAGSQER
jgi:hypothetical protein